MPILPRLSSLWRNLFHKASREQELAEEIDASPLRKVRSQVTAAPLRRGYPISNFPQRSDAYLELLTEQKINEALAPQAALGRTIAPGDDRVPGERPVCVISYSHLIVCSSAALSPPECAARVGT